MKTILSIFFAVLLLTNCVGKTTTVPPSATNEPATVTTQPVIEEENVKVTAEESAPLIIGGRQYRGQLGERVEVENGWWRIPNGPVNCTIDDIDKLFIMTLWVDPENPERRSSIENLEMLYNLKELHIRGENFDKVDFSPISSLLNLEELEIEGNITRLPDLTHLERLSKIEIKKSALESLKGICGSRIEKLNIQTSAKNNTVLKISDMKNMTGVESFWFEGGKIDLHAIENLSSLKFMYLSLCEPFNIEGIGQLQNLEQLTMNIIDPNPTIAFLKDLPNLESVNLHGNYNLETGDFYSYYEPTQVLDVSPLASLKKIGSISCDNFIIKNISALDTLDMMIINLWGSRLYDVTEKSKHPLYFKMERDG